MRTPRNHRHIPPLKPEQLIAAMERLNTSTNVSQRGREQIEAMLQAASDPLSQRPEVLIKTLPAERQENIAKIAQTYSTATKRIAKRGKAELEKISAREWDKLVEEAANGEA